MGSDEPGHENGDDSAGSDECNSTKWWMRPGEYRPVFDRGTGDFAVEMWMNADVTSRGDLFTYKGGGSDFGIPETLRLSFTSERYDEGIDDGGAGAGDGARGGEDAEADDVGGLDEIPDDGHCRQCWPRVATWFTD